MEKRLFVATTFLLLTLIANGQQDHKPDSILPNRKAVNAFGNATELLAKNANFPVDQLGPSAAGSEGDVILSLVIRKSGKSDSLSIVSSVGKSFSTSAIVAFSKLPDEWKPATINNEPVDRRYLIIFRYRKYLDTQPYDYRGKIAQLLSREKYKEALKQLNRAIQDNKYDSGLFDSRSKVKQVLGDEEGATADKSTSVQLSEGILSLVEVKVMGISTTKKVMIGTTTTTTRRVY
jgi:hypothetical protein